MKMADNPAAKVVLGNGRVLFDLTGDSIRAAVLLRGYTSHGPDGKPITGTCDYDANTQDANATPGEMLVGSSAWVRGKLVEGSMPRNESVVGYISTKDGKFIIPYGFHDGSGWAALDPAELAKVIPANIRSGVTLFGVPGGMTGTEGENRQEKTVTPSFSEQMVVPDNGYTCLTSVKVGAIPVQEIPNETGGITVIIG